MINQEAFERLFSRPLLWFVVTVVACCLLVDVQFITVDHRNPAQSELFALLDNLFAGILVSFVFYYLVVYRAERQRCARIRNGALRYYLSIKESLIWQIVFASRKAGRTDLENTQDQIDELMDVKEFKAKFSGGKQSDEGWYAFLNHLGQDSPEFREIMLNFTQLRAQVEYLLTQDAFRDDELLEFFVQLRRHLLRLERTEADDWEKRPLVSFLYEIFAGWDMVTGYRDFDIVEDRIRKIS